MVHESTSSRTPAIRTQGWSKDFGQGRGILDLDLTVHQGEVFGFIGPNGAGKSTTIRSLLGLLKPTAGKARVLGLDPHRHGDKLRRHVGYLPGEMSLWENRTGRRFLDDMAALRGGVDETVRDGLVRRLGVDLDTKVRRLSKGNKQKLGLVQAFMHEPALLVLDEPTDGLDPLLRREVHRLMNEAKARGATVFLSSHVIHEVEKVCDRLALVRNGRLLLTDHVANLRKRRRDELMLKLREPVQPSVFDVPGVARVRSRDPRTYRFLLDGPPQALLEAALPYGIEQVHTHTEDLEDALLFLYEGETQ